MDRTPPGAGLLHPAAALCVLVLIVNDHWGKAAWPGVVTGKLSDFAGLAFFPLLLQAAWEVGGGAVRPRVLAVTCVATAVAFALVKVWPPAHAAYEVGLGALQWPVHGLLAAWHDAPLPPVRRVRLEADPTDLMALPAVGLAWWWGRSRGGGVRPPAPTSPR